MADDTPRGKRRTYRPAETVFGPPRTAYTPHQNRCKRCETKLASDNAAGYNQTGLCSPCWNHYHQKEEPY